MKRRLLTLAFLLCVSRLDAQVVFDANATAPCQSLTGVTSFNCSTLTVGSGSNRALVCQIVWAAAVTTPTLTWDSGGTSQAMTAITNASATNTTQVMLFGLVAPTSGAKTLAVSWTTATQGEVNCLSYTGVDQTGGTTTFAHGTSATGTTSSGVAAGVTVTSAANNAVVAAHGTLSSWSSVSGTQTFLDNTPAAMSVAGNRAAGGASVTITGTPGSTGQARAHVGADIVAAAAGGTPGCKNGLLMMGAGCDEAAR